LGSFNKPFHELHGSIDMQIVTTLDLVTCFILHNMLFGGHKKKYWKKITNLKNRITTQENVRPQVQVHVDEEQGI
jgi:hypothetical protein